MPSSSASREALAAKGPTYKVSLHTLLFRVLKGYGARVGSRPWLFLLVGAALLVPFAVLGVLYALPETDYDTSPAWVPSSSRTASDAAAFDGAFGGLPREQAAAFTSREDGGSAATATALAASVHALRPLLNGSVTVADAASGADFGAAEFCERARVPATLRPPASESDVSVSSYYGLLTRCLNDRDAAAMPSPLPSLWGIDRFPCRRQSALDCFSEGALDYPEALAQLDGVSRLVAGHPDLAGCRAAVTADLQAGLDADGAAAVASLEQEVVFLYAPLFARWGYSWRVSFEALGTDAAIEEHLDTAESDAVLRTVLVSAAEECQASSSRACCLTWDGLPVSIGNVAAPRGGAAYGATRTVLRNWHQGHPEWRRVVPEAPETASARLALARRWEARWASALLGARNAEAGSGFAAGEAYSAVRTHATSARSRADAVEDATKDDLYLVYVGVALVAAYAVAAATHIEAEGPACACCKGGAASRRFVVLSRWLLALGGVACVVLAVLAAAGLAWLFGVPINAQTASVVLLLGLGLGVDDAFVITNGYVQLHARVDHGFGKGARKWRALQAAKGNGDPAELYPHSDLASFHQARETLKYTSALVFQSVLFTSACNATLFGVASALADVPLVRDATALMGLAVTTVLLALFLLFLPLVAYDSRRVRSGRAVLCCLGGRREDGDTSARPLKPPPLRSLNDAAIAAGTDSAGTSGGGGGGGGAGGDRGDSSGGDDAGGDDAGARLRPAAGDDEAAANRGVLDVVLHRCFGPALLRLPVKFAVLLVFFGLFLTAVLLADRPAGFDESETLPDGSFERDYLELREEAFAVHGQFLFTPSGAPLSEAATQEALKSAVSRLDAVSYARLSATRTADQSWLLDQRSSLLVSTCLVDDGFDISGSDTLCNSTTAGDPPAVQEDAFGDAAASWMAVLGALYSPDVLCRVAATGEDADCASFDAAVHELGATRSDSFVASVGSTGSFLAAMRESRAAVDGADGDTGGAAVHGRYFRANEQYEDASLETMRVLGLALLCAAVVAGVLLGNPLLAFLLGVVSAMSGGFLWSLMSVWDVDLNSFSQLTLAVSLAMTIDFCGHLAYVYQAKEREAGNNAPMLDTMRVLFGAILHGGFTTLVALVPLFFGSFPFQERYYVYSFAAMVAIALAHALVLFPVVLFATDAVPGLPLTCGEAGGGGGGGDGGKGDEEMADLTGLERSLTAGSLNTAGSA